MCGRFTLRIASASWCQMFLPEWAEDSSSPSTQAVLDNTRPRYNIAPTQSIACVNRVDAGQPRQLFFARWGLLPSWADGLSIGNRMINARSETVDSKPSFKRAFASRRCLIPADGYFEWTKTAGGKQPYLIERPDHGVLAMAGLWEENKKLGSEDEPLVSCTILTTDANDTTGQIHNRMPVFLDFDTHDQWLDPGSRDVEALKSLLIPAPEDWLQATPVSKRVNSAKNDDPACIEPVAATGQLFD
ncbi:MAG: SOS response-associated peptidase [Pirellulaceae bacterium]|nr:SOS response-associated peptidase [Pirellulaceae bacterium]